MGLGDEDLKKKKYWLSGDDVPLAEPSADEVEPTLGDKDLTNMNYWITKSSVPLADMDADGLERVLGDEDLMKKDTAGKPAGESKPKDDVGK
jgi:hypothetical protein